MDHLLLWGNAYAQIIRDGRGKMIAFYLLMPDKMTVNRTEKEELNYMYNKEGMIYPLRSDEALHIPGLGFDGIVGYSPIAIATEEYGAKFFANGANPGGCAITKISIKTLPRMVEYPGKKLCFSSPRT